MKRENFVTVHTARCIFALQYTIRIKRVKNDKLFYLFNSSFNQIFCLTEKNKFKSIAVFNIFLYLYIFFITLLLYNLHKLLVGRCLKKLKTFTNILIQNANWSFCWNKIRKKNVLYKFISDGRLFRLTWLPTRSNMFNYWIASWRNKKIEKRFWDNFRLINILKFYSGWRH